MMMRFWNLAMQYARFGGVGLTSLAVYTGCFAWFIEFFQFTPLMANFLAFGISFCISFFGHFYWTFASGSRSRAYMRAAVPRFLVTAMVGLGLNTAIVYVVDAVLVLPYLYAILGMVFLVPPIVFVISKYWAFAHTARD